MSEQNAKPINDDPEAGGDETQDVVIDDLHANKNRTKAISDLSRMLHATNKTVADIVENLSTEDGDKKENRRKQPSSSDLVGKSGFFTTLANDDLNYAEIIQAKGNHREREQSGLSEMVIQEEIENKDKPEDFPLNRDGLTSAEAEERLQKYGRNELPEKSEPKWLIFCKLLIQPMPVMIWIAAIIELAIGNYLDMGILLGIQFTNASISFYETNKAGNAIAALKNSLKPQATVKRDGKWQQIEAALVVPGDTCLLASGSAIPADCRVNHGEIEVDQAALTGESLPVTFYKNDSCKMGSTVVRGEVDATVEFTGSETFFGKTALLLTDSTEPSHLQKILIRVMLVLVTLSLTLCLINFIYLLVKGQHVKEALTFTVVILVASIPLAIEIVTTTTLAIGSKKLVYSGAIVARLAAIEDLASMNILCSDKTGTLTLNKMVLQDDTPTFTPDKPTQEMVLVYAALAAKWHEPPRDALDRLTLGSVNFALLENYEQLDYMPFDPTTKRTEGTLKDKRTGEQFKTSKGAPHVILKLLDAGETGVREAVESHVARLGEKGIRSLAVAKTDAEGKWHMVGLLTFLDPPRPDTKQTIHEANEYGVKVTMITGDHLLIALNTAEQLEMGNRIFGSENLPMLDAETKQKPDNLSRDYGDLCLAADGFAQVYPEHKYLIVECLREMGYTVGMTGDGVNDAPALKRADVGIAVAGATDAARAAADIVLTKEGLSVIIEGIELARAIFARMNNFITYRISATLQLLLFFFISIFAFRPNKYEESWPEYFHMPVLMLMLITLLNDGTLITIAYDHAEASKSPCHWNLPVTFIASSVLGLVSLISSLILLQFLLNANNEGSLFQKCGLSGFDYGQVTTAIYLKISVSDFLTLFSARTGDKYFFQIKPALVLFCGGAFALALSSILSIFWPNSNPDGIPTEGLRDYIGVFGFVWIFCLVFFVIQDVFKVWTIRAMAHFNLFGYRSTGEIVLPESTKKLMKELDEAALKAAANPKKPAHGHH